MRLVFISSLALFFSTSVSSAALPSDAGSAVSFFRHRTSAFPSGQASRSSLENTLKRTENEISFRTEWNHKQYTLLSTQILRDIQVARFVETKEATSLLSQARSDSTKIKTVPAKASLEILETDDLWARVKDGATTGWMPLHQLKNKHDDTGVYVNLLETALRPRPDSSTTALRMIPRLQRIIPLEISKNFLKVQYQGQTGYADLTHFVSRADFAKLAYHPQKQWFPVLYRNNDMVIGQKGEVLPLKDIQGFVTLNSKGIVFESDDFNGPQIRSRVDIIKPEAYIWGVSKVDGHGEVWWKKKDLLLETPTLKSSTVSTDELLKREIYSIAFESKSSLKGLVSSNGVYRTEDGQTWTEISLFTKKNLPVSIHPNGTWFVGAYKSSDKGKTFEPFIRWDRLAQAIESAYHRNPKILRVTRIEPLPNSHVLISVDTGTNNVKLKSLIGDFSWSVVRN